jgi:hypothetical protein
MARYFLLCLCLAKEFCPGIALNNDRLTYHTGQRDGKSSDEATDITKRLTETGKSLATGVTLPLLGRPTIFPIAPSPDLSHTNISTTTIRTSTFGWLDLGRKTTQSISTYDPSPRLIGQDQSTLSVPLSRETSTITNLEATDPFPYFLSLTEPRTTPISYVTSTTETTNDSIPYLQSLGWTTTLPSFLISTMETTNSFMSYLQTATQIPTAESSTTESSTTQTPTSTTLGEETWKSRLD